MIHAFFFLAAFVLGLVSLIFVSQATLGVWMVGAACLAAIFSRMAQADDHHEKVIEALKQMQVGTEPTPAIGPSGESV